MTMGCIARLGCLILLAVAAAVGWLTRDHWLPERYRRTAAVHTPTWEPLSAAGAERTRVALEKLSRPSGPVFQTLSGADVASYVARAVMRSMPASADSVQVMVDGDRIAVRANVKLSDLGGAAGLGAIGAMLGDREPVQITGTIKVVRPGLGELQATDVKIRGLSVPRGMIATLMQRLSRGSRDPALDANGLPVPLPRYVGDIRVADGKITLYKNVQ
jgi:hypothetical protein